uniref:Uncharacterized protein n=1 Tax=Hyaloperonospora arabidopsidis (strain Emoy2) TaxID=559515 RepID=M4BWG3_HYAAE
MVLTNYLQLLRMNALLEWLAGHRRKQIYLISVSYLFPLTTGSAIIKKHHKVKRCHRGIKEAPSLGQERSLVDLVNGGGEINVGRESSGVGSTDYSIVSSEFVEEELQSCQADRLAYPPCLLFLDSLRCHRKKKFTKMLRNYLEPREQHGVNVNTEHVPRRACSGVPGIPAASTLLSAISGKTWTSRAKYKG